jgi:hypothetical protein
MPSASSDSPDLAVFDPAVSRRPRGFTSWVSAIGRLTPTAIVADPISNQDFL